MDLKIGMDAPKFSLSNHEGINKTNENYLGKNLIIYFYPKDDTPGCTKESCRFRDLSFELDKLNCNVIGISADDMKSHKEFIKKYNLNFELLCDVNFRMSKDYETFFVSDEFGNSINRTTFFIDKKGLIKNVWRDIKNPEDHPVEVIDFLKSH